MMVVADGACHSEALAASNFRPSGGRSLEKTADVLSTGWQPTRKALPQLIPDGLPLHLHLQAALGTKHPLAYPPRATAPVEYALKYAAISTDETRERRNILAGLLRQLAAATMVDNELLLTLVDPSVATVLRAFGVKNVAFMREVAFLVGARDISSPAFLLIGLPMLGWAPGADGLMDRIREPEMSVDEFVSSSADRNKRLLATVRASEDDELDTETFAKTMAELKGV